MQPLKSLPFPCKTVTRSLTKAALSFTIVPSFFPASLPSSLSTLFLFFLPSLPLSFFSEVESHTLTTKALLCSLAWPWTQWNPLALYSQMQELQISCGGLLGVEAHAWLWSTILFYLMWDKNLWQTKHLFLQWNYSTGNSKNKAIHSGGGTRGAGHYSFVCLVFPFIISWSFVYSWSSP